MLVSDTVNDNAIPRAHAPAAPIGPAASVRTTAKRPPSGGYTSGEPACKARALAAGDDSKAQVLVRAPTSPTALQHASLICKAFKNIFAASACVAWRYLVFVFLYTVKCVLYVGPWWALLAVFLYIYNFGMPEVSHPFVLGKSILMFSSATARHLFLRALSATNGMDSTIRNKVAFLWSYVWPTFMTTTTTSSLITTAEHDNLAASSLAAQTVHNGMYPPGTYYEIFVTAGFTIFVVSVLLPVWWGGDIPDEN